MTDTPPPRPQQQKPQPDFWILLALVVAVAVALAARNSEGLTFGITNQMFVRAGYAAVIAIFLVGLVLSRGFSGLVRMAASWLAIGLILVGGYAYRDDLFQVGARIAGVLVPGVPISGELTGGPENTVVITRASDGHFAVRARVDRAPTTFMLDTGASFVTLTPRDAARAGVDTRSLDFSTPIRTANGEIKAATVTIDTLKVGTIERHKVAALVAPPDSLDQSLLGLSFLNTLHGYAISGDRLVLTP
jgi:aspartyl protease family protein